MPLSWREPQGLRGMFGGEQSLTPPVLRHARTARHSDRDGRRLQHHAGPHHARAARRRSAGRHDQPAAGQRRLVRFPPRAGRDRDRRRRRRDARWTSIDEAVAALSPRPAPVTPPVDSRALTPSGCNRAAPSARAPSPRARCLTTSPIDTMPTSWPCSTTGRWRNFPAVIRSMIGDGVGLAAGHDLARHHLGQTADRAQPRHARQARARCRAPTGCRPRAGPAPVTTSAPILRSARSLAAAARFVGRLDGENVAALRGQNGFDGHWVAP